MAEYDKNRFKLAVPEWCIPGDCVFAIRMAAEAGLEGVQIEAGWPFTGFKLAHKRVRELYLETADRYGVELISIAMNDLDFHGLRHGKGTEAGDIAWEHLNVALEAAGDMGIKAVMIPHFLDNEVHTDEERANAVEALRYACDYAKDKGFLIGAETAIPADDFIGLAKEVGRDNLRLYHDSENYMSFGGLNPMDHLPAVYPYMLDQVHVKDGTGRTGSSKLLGEGDSHFAEQIAWLKANGYSGWFVFENYYCRLPLRKEAKDPMDLLKKDMEILRAELAK